MWFGNMDGGRGEWDSDKAHFTSDNKIWCWHVHQPTQTNTHFPRELSLEATTQLGSLTHAFTCGYIFHATKLFLSSAVSLTSLSLVTKPTKLFILHFLSIIFEKLYMRSLIWRINNYCAVFNEFQHYFLKLTCLNYTNHVLMYVALSVRNGLFSKLTVTKKHKCK